MNILIPSALFLRDKEKNYAYFVHEDMSLGRCAKDIYLWLFYLAQDTGSVSLTLKDLANDVLLSVQTLQKAVNSLVAAKYIDVENTPGLPCKYTLLLSDHVLAQIKKCGPIVNPAMAVSER
jgi:hypothetical protein